MVDSGSGGGSGDELVDGTGCGSGGVKLLASGGGAAWDCDCDDALGGTRCDGVVGELLSSAEGGSIGVRPASCSWGSGSTMGAAAVMPFLSLQAELKFGQHFPPSGPHSEGFGGAVEERGGSWGGSTGGTGMSNLARRSVTRASRD